MIEVDRVSKRYRLGAGSYRTLRETLAGVTRRNKPRPEIWALRDVSLAVEEGEVLGIVGNNGAGKTTLLRVIARITEPTSGVARMRGRVGTLLEVGTGFHPELTGRENIYLNGAVLGMRRREIERELGSIVAFAEIEPFLETPVKRYSSGMHMRLAFAVAAHLQPEIMLVDEVLAVGDTAFQKRCLGRMGDVASEGRTVLFVSHNLAAVESLCRRAIWLDDGGVVADGAARQVVSDYLRSLDTSRRERLWRDDEAPEGGGVRLLAARARPAAGTPEDELTTGTAVAIEIEYQNLREGAHLTLGLHVYDERGVLAFGAFPVEETVWFGRPFPAGRFRDTCVIPADLLNDGRYRIELLVVTGQTDIVLRVEDLLILDVRDAASGAGVYGGEWQGVVRPRVSWKTDLLGRNGTA